MWTQQIWVYSQLIYILKINGCDIHNLRIEGKRISETEELLLKKCIINPKLNTRENLIKLIKENN